MGKGKLVAAIALVASMPLLPACVVEAGMGAGLGMAVSSPPPAPMNEGRPPPPPGHATWIAGYWHWTGMQYTWIPGHWDVRAGVWRPPRYSLREGTYFYEPGAWSRAER